jgi:hypothetical protein
MFSRIATDVLREVFIRCKSFTLNAVCIDNIDMISLLIILLFFFSFIVLNIKYSIESNIADTRSYYALYVLHQVSTEHS